MSFNVNTFNSDNWHREAQSTAERDRIKARRWGMRVTVYQGVDAGDYVLTYNLNSTDRQDNDNWLKVADIGDTWGAGGGSVNIYNSDGVVTGSRSIDGDGFDITFDNFSTFDITASGAVSIAGGLTSFLTIDSTISGAYIDGVDQSTFAMDRSLSFTIRDDIDFSANNGSEDISMSAGSIAISSSGQLDLLTGVRMNFVAVDFGLNGSLATDPTIQFFAGDGSWRYALGQALDSTVTSPTAGEDGYVIAWNDANQEYELVAQSGGGVTADNGLNESAGNIQLGGPLTEDTLINGGTTYDLIFGTFATDPLGGFQVYASEGIFFSNRDGGGNTTGFTVGAGGSNLSMSAGPFLVSNSVAIATASNDLVRVVRNSSNTNDTGVIASWTASTSGAAAAGLGMSFTFGIENSAAAQPEAGREVYSWASPTSGAEYAAYLQRLKVNSAMQDVISITTNSTAPNIFTTLSGQLILPNLPSSDPGVPGYLYHTAGAVMVSL